MKNITYFKVNQRVKKDLRMSYLCLERVGGIAYS